MKFPVPYTTRLREKIQVGQMISIKGEAAKVGQSFELNLLSGGTDIKSSDTEVIFHMKLYLNPKDNNGKHTVFSAKYENSWHDQALLKDQFVKIGEKFEIRVRALTDHYEVRVNGKLAYKFDYEFTKPIDRVQLVHIDGDVTLENVRWSGQIYSVPWETAMPDKGPLKLNKKINISGVTEGDWRVDLVDKKGTIVCRFNPRLKEKAVFRSAVFQGTEWGKKEKEGVSPFEKNKGFTLTLLNAPYGLQFYVDGKHFAAFSHRTNDPSKDYVGLKIDGDLEVTEIEFD